MLTLETVPTPRPNVIGRVVDQEAVLVLPQQGQVKVLNEVGAAIWALLDGERNIRQISAEICKQFEVEPVIAETDTLKFIADLVERKIVSI